MTLEIALDIRYMQSMEQQTLTSAEIARSLNVTLMTINNWRKGSPERPPLPYSMYRVGKARRILVHACDLTRWLANNRSDLLPLVNKIRSG